MLRLLLIVGLVGCFTQQPPPASAVSPPVVAAAPAQEPPPVPTLATLTFEGTTFKSNDRVRVTQFAGTVKPIESGHPKDLDLGPGRLGTFLGGQRLENYKGYGVTVELAIVRWDAQTWTQYVSMDGIVERGKSYTAQELEVLYAQASEIGPAVQLPSFVSTLAVGYLEHVR